MRLVPPFVTDTLLPGRSTRKRMRKRLLRTFAALSATVVLAVQANAAAVFVDENSIDAVTSPGGTRVDVTLAVDCFPFSGEVNPRISSVSLRLDQALTDGQIVGGSQALFTNVACDGSRHFFDFEIFQSFTFRSWDCGPDSNPADVVIRTTVASGPPTGRVTHTFEIRTDISIDCFDDATDSDPLV